MTRSFAGAVLAALLTVLVGAAPAAADESFPQQTRFQNLSSSKCLTVMFPGYLDGSPALQTDCAWSVVFQRESSVSGQWSTVHTLVITGPTVMCLQIDPNGGVVQRACDGGRRQQWHFVPYRSTGNSALSRWLAGSIMIQNAYTVECLEVHGDIVVQNDCTRDLNQLWFTD